MNENSENEQNGKQKQNWFFSTMPEHDTKYINNFIEKRIYKLFYSTAAAVSAEKKQNNADM